MNDGHANGHHCWLETLEMGCHATVVVGFCILSPDISRSFFFLLFYFFLAFCFISSVDYFLDKSGSMGFIPTNWSTVN